jgi:hypothetical protein
MTTLRILTLALAAFALSFAVRADDPPVDKSERVAVRVNHEQIKDDAKGVGHKISRFFVHDVGGTIGNGLKKGTSKVSDAFK